MNHPEENSRVTLANFMLNGFAQIEGWCSPLLVDFLALIDDTQRRHGARGGIAEIGVHHGKFFLLLEQFTDSNEQNFAIDVFEDQHLNIDMSGRGSIVKFRSNLAMYAKNKGDNVEVVAQDSTSTDLVALIRPPVRIFSVDGGHTPEHTINDLRLAERVLHPMGVVILDDILNPHWLGVIEGLTHYLGHYPTLVPFAIGHNKLFLCKLSYFRSFSDAFRLSKWNVKYPVIFFGHQLSAI